MDDARLSTLRADLLAWWDGNGRHELPWRLTRDPWAVLVSELMLQQTQVARVVERWPAFVERFPTATACAAAPVGDAVRAWAGLGYNRRAVNLHRCASIVVERHGGELPEDLGALLALPGIGPYTARAVLVFANGRDFGLVDTTAGRFLARAVAGRPLADGEAQAVADAMVAPGAGYAWGSAVFDVAALVCTRRAPRCADCPLLRSCAWATAGWPAPDPVAGSAGVSGGQSPFNGSDRQGRGALVAALRAGPVPAAVLAAACGWPTDPHRAGRIAAGLVADGLAVADPTTGTLHLP
ncbi:MAG: A/G-specific adenine glycosylase [Acidimicrobiales bacterium]